MAAVVLIVDDDEDQRLILRRFLARHGFVVREAEDGRKALGFLEEPAPDWIVLDLDMPVLDGFGFLRERELLHLAPKARVIIHSGSSTAGAPSNCALVPKPFEATALLRALAVEQGVEP